MNKLTLLSLSLLMISASCNAMDPKPMGPEPKVFGTEIPRPNNKITKFIVGSLIQSNPQGWSRQYYRNSYNPANFKRLALDPKSGGVLRDFTDWWRYGSYEGDYLVDTTDTTDNDIDSMKIGFGLEKSDNPARKRELTHFFTHFEVKGP